MREKWRVQKKKRKENEKCIVRKMREKKLLKSILFIYVSITFHTK